MESEVERVYRAYNAAENAHDLRATTALVSDDLTVTINGLPRLGSASDDEKANELLFECFPDYRREIVDVLVDGERGTIRWRMVGSPASGLRLPRLDVHGCSIVTVSGGRITHAHLYVDGATLEAVLPQEST